jgi:gliding motility-associated-like protein
MKKATIITFLLSILYFPVNAQITCNGVWGQKMVNQTFGQGTATAIWYGPLSTYAPGASTSTIFVGAAGPVGGQLSDGYSGLAKTPSASNQGNWINVSDHTGDANGLLFLINAPSTAATVFFEYPMDNLCPNTILKLSVWILNVNDPSITSNPSYQYPNMTLNAIDPVTNVVLGSSQSGNVAADQVWHQYSVVFNNGFSSSVKLQLVNNSVGSGYGNDLAIDDITVQPCVPLTQILPKLDTAICQGSSLNFNASVLNSPYNPAEYQWQISNDGGNTWANQGAAGPNVNLTFNSTPLAPGTYMVRFITGPQGTTTNTNCGAISDTSLIEVVALPHDIINESVCLGNSYNFFGHYIGIPGTYDTLIKSGPGDLCGTLTTLNLTVKPLPDTRIVNNKIDLCEGDNIALKLLLPSAGANYQWIKNGASLPGETGVQYLATNGGIYHVAGELNGCVDTSERIVINERPLPITSIINKNEPSCSYDTLSFKAGNQSSTYIYSWSPEKAFRAITGSDGPTAKGTFSENTMVNLTIYTSYGCHTSDSTMALVHPCCEVFTPTAFSPNNDGMNDYFNPSMEPGQIIVSMKIFDRYGKLVYNNGDLKKGWNGNYINSDPASNGVYMYQLQYTCSDNKPYYRKGDLTLIR